MVRTSHFQCGNGEFNSPRGHQKEKNMNFMKKLSIGLLGLILTSHFVDTCITIALKATN